jgi:hypothetical protein
MQADWQPQFPLLYSIRGSHYCDLQLAEAERLAWQRLILCPARQSHVEPNTIEVPPHGPAGNQSIASADAMRVMEVCRSVLRRAEQTLNWAEFTPNASVLTNGLDHLTLARSQFYAAILHRELHSGEHLKEAMDFLRRAGAQDHLPLGLLTCAMWGGATGAFDGAREDLDEAFEIAERGPMPLYLADIHLHRARLFGLLANRPAAYPWVSARDDLDWARELINKCDYGRRRGELEDAEAAWRRLHATP